MTTKSSRRREKQQNMGKPKEEQQQHFKMGKIVPKTENQATVFNAFHKKNLLLHGYAGTGKTFIALYLAFNAVLNGDYKKVVIVRSSVTTRDIGFMPGDAAAKMKNYEAPYMAIASELFGRGDAYGVLKQKNQVAFIPTSFIRGITLDDTIIVVDEAQNMSDNELNSIITRVGQNTKLIICGDVRQDDLTNPRFKEVSGLAKIMNILKMMNVITTVEFQKEDIVRSDFLKDYIIARDDYERKQFQRDDERKISLPAFITEAPTFEKIPA